MTTDRDMDRAQELRSRLTGYLASPAHEADAVRIATALAAERAPLEAQLSRVATALGEHWTGELRGVATDVRSLCAKLSGCIDARDAARDMHANAEAAHVTALVEIDKLRAKLAEAEHERGLAIALMTDAGVEPVPDDCDGKLLGQVELMRQMWAADRAEVERLRAELAYARRAAIMPEPILAAAEERGARWGIEAMFDAGHPHVSLMEHVPYSTARPCAADVVRAAREREAAETKSEPPKVGDRVRVVRCCAPGGDDHDDCASFEGHAGTLEDIHEGSDEPFRVEGINGEGWGWFAEVERVDELQITAAECDEMVTRADLDAFRGELAAAIREVSDSRAANAYYNNAVEVLRFVADRLEAER